VERRKKKKERSSFGMHHVWTLSAICLLFRPSANTLSCLLAEKTTLDKGRENPNRDPECPNTLQTYFLAPKKKPKGSLFSKADFFLSKKLKKRG